ncbi:UDP-N-acetylglucosamine 1-carboxyvinyltransferase [Candidatus Roizmanbacteria bacterium RIFCSPLOWO2_01_FULL_38_11]|uniref:UDP-N-acetylglucosamine 1-carboxyvinyltransferase n=1 Tax=Candidatus Roizmanbacteria bacterium RIFCSPLOWO2_01_FULL_38_11 TaxID=1802060 RepID=A0A1F7INJ9_9BACT|nr:MAG: UDP-N-acetylglucosamine 1-carboxyvinyltransferase [Candidatus Roizmanbacteria bacterium RIFCSPLOWO2_01_FULL_38_11]
MNEDALIVQGGKPLKGEVNLSGAKNIALKVLITGLLYDEPVIFENIPHIGDINEIIHLINDLGAKAEFIKNNVVKIDPHGLKRYEIDLLHGSKIRVSFMFFAPLLYCFGKAVIPNPGGCRLGARPIDRHIDMLKAFGVEIGYNSETGFYEAQVNDEIHGCAFTFDKPTHTGTELALMMASIAKGNSVIHNAALEPEIDDLINLFNQSGAQINREGSSITVRSTKEKLKIDHPYSIQPDRNEAPTFAAFALATKGDIYVKGITDQALSFFLEELKEINAGVEQLKDGIRFYYKGKLKSSHITTCPHPGFMTDWQGPWALLMTQAEGESTIHETIFENRFGYVSELQKLGARIEFFQPELNNPESVYQFKIEEPTTVKDLQQAIKIYGPVKLHNGVMEVKDLRAGATILIAACMAEGESVVQGVSTIDRGYENIEGKLIKLGADIKRV